MSTIPSFSPSLHLFSPNAGIISQSSNVVQGITAYQQRESQPITTEPVDSIEISAEGQRLAEETESTRDDRRIHRSSLSNNDRDEERFFASPPNPPPSDPGTDAKDSFASPPNPPPSDPGPG